jgi:hypothetical protein
MSLRLLPSALKRLLMSWIDLITPSKINASVK